MRRFSFMLGFAAAAAMGAVGRVGNAHDILRPSSAASLFFIAKSQNRNQVHYGVRLESNCAPMGQHPVYAYWRMFERGGEREPLLANEQAAYGIEDEVQMSATGDGSRIRFRLRGLPQRPVTVTIARTSSGCTARADASIAGQDAQLGSIYLKLRWPFGVEYVIVQGARLRDGTWLVETVRDAR